MCGFSGTSDNRQLLPFSVKPEWPEDAATQGTDGKMVILLTTAGKCKFMRLADVAQATLGTLRRHSLGTAATATDGLHLDAQAQAGAHGARNGIAAPPAGSNASDAAAPAYHGSQLLDAVVLLGVHALIDAGAVPLCRLRPVIVAATTCTGEPHLRARCTANVVLNDTADSVRSCKPLTDLDRAQDARLQARC